MPVKLFSCVGFVESNNTKEILMRKKIMLAFITFTLIALLLAGCNNARANVFISEKNIPAFDSVSITASSSMIEFVASDRYGVEIFVPEEFSPEWDVVNGKLTIFENANGFRFPPSITFSKNYVKVYYTAGTVFNEISLRASSGSIELPQAVVSYLNATTSSRRINASTEKCDSTYIKTESGDVNFSGCVGDVDITTYSGAVKSEISNCDAISVKTHSGRVTLAAEGDLATVLTVSTSSGSIRADGIAWRDVKTETSSGSTDISGELFGDTYVKASSGDVKLSISSDPSQYGYSLEPGSGSIHWNGEKIGKPAHSSCSYEKNIVVDTSSGSIRVEFD
jgi:hypothetical protein